MSYIVCRVWYSIVWYSMVSYSIRDYGFYAVLQGLSSGSGFKVEAHQGSGIDIFDSEA